jgi:enoyl-CoA hydratase/carnithine racemase
MSKHTTLSVRELADGAAHADLIAADASVVDPLLVVDLDRVLGGVTEAELRRAGERARECDRLLIGMIRGSLPDTLRPLAESLDLTLTGETRGDDTPYCSVAVADPVAEVTALQDRIESAAQPALLLARILRVGESLTVRQALDVESLAYSTLLAGPGFAAWLAARGERPVPPPQTEDAVIIRRDGGTLRLTLNRPQRHNAHDRSLRDALVAGLRIAELDDTVAEVLLDARGPSFSSGGDLDEFGTAPDPATAHLIRTRAGAARPLHDLHRRLTARIHGHCVGAGIELPAFAGRVVADPGTVVRLPELELGLIPGAGGTVSLPRRIGRWRTLYLVLTGVAIPATVAYRWGLVDRIEPVAPAEVTTAPGTPGH